MLNKTVIALGFFLCGLAIASDASPTPTPSLDPASIPWEKMGESDGIKVYRKELPGSPLVSFRGEAVIDAPISKVLAVLEDSTRKVEWMHNLADARELRKVSKFVKVEYNHTSVPWPFFDREFIYIAEAVILKDSRQCLIRVHSIEDPSIPVKDGIVRGWLEDTLYTVSQVGEDGMKTHIDVHVTADPRGDIPKWLVNLFQKGWPEQTLRGIRRQSAKPDIQESREVRELFFPFHASVPKV